MSKDISQSIELYEIAKAIQELNPNAEIRVGNPEFDSLALDRFFSSVPAEQLVLPNGFYYNTKNGVTNKHNTESGVYCAFMVEDLSRADERMLLPRFEKTETKDNLSSLKKDQTILKKISNVFKKRKSKNKESEKPIELNDLSVNFNSKYLEVINKSETLYAWFKKNQDALEYYGLTNIGCLQFEDWGDIDIQVLGRMANACYEAIEQGVPSQMIQTPSDANFAIETLAQRAIGDMTDIYENNKDKISEIAKEKYYIKRPEYIGDTWTSPEISKGIKK